MQLISIVRLLLSCLHAWDLDSDLDKACICQLGLVKPTRPVSYGLLSRGHCLSLVLPGWGIHKVFEKEQGDETLEKKYAQLNAVMTAHQLRWQLSQSLTTQHLLTVVSITNTLMNQSFGARMLAKEGGARNLVSISISSDDSDEEEDQGGQVTDCKWFKATSTFLSTILTCITVMTMQYTVQTNFLMQCTAYVFV